MLTLFLRNNFFVRTSVVTGVFTLVVCIVSAARAADQLSVPDYYRADYGKQIAGVDGKTAVWWCDATHKIAPQRALPAESTPAATLSAAGNDFEAVQIVVRPTEPLKGFTATAGAFTGPDGATIPAENVEILRVNYPYTHSPTDKTGVRDWWPDAVPQPGRRRSVGC